MSTRPFAKTLAHAAAAAALCLAVQAQAVGSLIDETPSAEAMAFDLFIVRPLGLVGTVLGAAIFVVSLPIDLISFNFADPARRLVVEPAKFTFTRDLGALE
jgi:ABC-type Fe3+ transport system permease subunit